MNHKLPKTEKLKRSKIIELLFKEGKSVKAFPFILVYMETALPEEVPIQTGFSVPKRNHKLAVTRNRIKRQLREAYRLNKTNFKTNGATFAFMFIYVGKEVPDYDGVVKAMNKLIAKFNGR